MARVGVISSDGENASRRCRFARHGLPPDFDRPIAIIDPDDAKPAETRTADELRDVLVKFLPFLLVMWTMAGALHPAIDLTAGEKERGTMETLLIARPGARRSSPGNSWPCSRSATLRRLWNLIWMAAGAILLGALLPSPILSFSGLGWSAPAGRPARGPLQLSRPRPRRIRSVHQGGSILPVATHALDPAAQHVRSHARLEADAGLAPSRCRA